MSSRSAKAERRTARHASRVEAHRASLREDRARRQALDRRGGLVPQSRPLPVETIAVMTRADNYRRLRGSLLMVVCAQALQEAKARGFSLDEVLAELERYEEIYPK